MYLFYLFGKSLNLGRHKICEYIREIFDDFFPQLGAQSKHISKNSEKYEPFFNFLSWRY